MLTRLYVNNYRCLVNFEFKPSSKQLILGRNGSGKSTVLDVLSLLRDFSVHGHDMDGFVGTTKTRWLSDVGQQRFELEVIGNHGEYQYLLDVEEWGNQSRPRVVRETVYYNDSPIFYFENGEVFLYNDREVEKQVEYPFDWHRSALATIRERKDNTKLTWFKRWLGSLIHVQINPWEMLARSEVESTEPAANMGNFADWYRHLLQDNGASVYKALAELKKVIPGLESLDAKEAGLNVRYLQAAIRHESGGKVQYSFSELSEGQRALIILYILNYCGVKPGSTLLIDEPDNFIALAEIQPWLLNLLDRVDDQNSQVILVSHHPELLNQLASQGGIIFERPEGLHTRVGHFDPTEDSGLTPAEFIARGWEGA